MAGGNSNPLPPSDRAIEHDERGLKREVRMVMAEARAARLLGKMTGSSSGGTALPPTLLEPLIADNAVTLLQEALAALGEIATTIGDIVERLEELEAILATFKDALSTAALEAELEAEEEAELEAEEEEEPEAEKEEAEEPVQKPTRGRRKRST